MRAGGGKITFSVDLYKHFPFEDDDEEEGQVQSASASASTAVPGRKALRDRSRAQGHRHVLAEVEIGRAAASGNGNGNGFDADAAVSISVKSSVGNRIALSVHSTDEKLFGLGERFGPANQRGRKTYCWAEDGGWSLGPLKRLPKGPETTYMPVPFLLSSRGYGLWLNTTRRTDWDLDSSGEGHYSLQVEDRELNLVLINGRSPARSLEIFTALSKSRSLIPPEFQFGPWNNFRNEFSNSMQVSDQANKFVELDIPSSVTDFAIHFLPSGWVTPDDEKGLKEQTDTLRSYGIPALAYYNSMIDAMYSSVYTYAREQGLFIKNKKNETWNFYYKGADYKPFKVGLLDFTNPQAVSLFKGLMSNATRSGFQGFMYDYGEYVDPDMRFSDGTTGYETHNAYPLQYQSVAHEYFTTPSETILPSKGEGYAPPYIFYVRSGYTGTGGKVWAAWTGDPTSNFDDETGLPAQVKAMLSAGLSGIPFIGSDIGGFVWIEPPSLELWVRWVQVGAVSGIMRMQTGGTSLLGIPKTHIHDTKQGTAIYRRYAKLRTSLFPYLYTAAHETRSTGIPLMRSHLLTHSEDGVAVDQEYQWMLGSSLLCAPVLRRSQHRQKIYLPAGDTWYDLMSQMSYDEEDGRHRIFGSDLVKGGQWVEVDASLEKLPIFVKAGSAIPALDPTVDTLNEATDSRVVSKSQMGHVLHMWVFPDEKYHAEGTTWDGVDFRFDQVEGGQAFVLDGQDENQRSWIIQIAAKNVVVETIVATGEAGNEKTISIPRLQSWQEVAETCVDPGTKGTMGWTVDMSSQSLWICFDTSLSNNLRLIKSSVQYQ